ncbi:MAG: TRAP transporter large permease subunit [Rhodospirillales bacterium]
MALTDILVILMVAALCGGLLCGFPVAFTLAGVALVFAVFGAAFGAFDFTLFGTLPSRIYGASMTNEILVAVPLFIFMGIMLERSKVAEELLETMGDAFGALKGGLGLSVCLVGALMAASTGIVGATVVTMGLMSLPTMLKRGYSAPLACASICASGTLGQIIPPSIVLVLLGDQISNAYVAAQRSLGNWSPDPVSVGDLFAGALLPGLLLVTLYLLYQLFMAWFRPEHAPAMPPGQIVHRKDLGVRVLHALLPPIILIVAVLGSILSGIATPTEAAAVGATGSLLLAGGRLGEDRKPIYIAGLCLLAMLVLANTLDLRVGRTTIPLPDKIGIGAAVLACAGLAWGLITGLRVTWRHRTAVTGTPVLRDVMNSTMRMTAMVFAILIGASVFSLVFRGLGGDDLIHKALGGLPGGAAGALIVVMLAMFVLGFFLDFIEIIFVVVPLVAPVLLKLGIDPVWLGVMMAVNLQTSFMTPPFGFSLFYLRGVAPDSVKTMDIYKGVAPFVGLQIAGLGLIALFPAIATWLPKVLFK